MGRLFYGLSRHMNWIPRNQRWTKEERARREMIARQQRELNHLYWLEQEKMRIEIEMEIQSIKIKRIKLLEF